MNFKYEWYPAPGQDMALRSNTDLLTGSAVHRRKPREKSNLTIVFDEKSRA